MRSAHLTDPHTDEQITVPKIRNINKQIAFQFQHPRLFVHVTCIIKLSSIIIRNKTTSAKQHCSLRMRPDSRLLASLSVNSLVMWRHLSRQINANFSHNYFVIEVPEFRQPMVSSVRRFSYGLKTVQDSKIGLKWF